jgi:hypothetical protein
MRFSITDSTTWAGVVGDSYYGPDGFSETRGHPVPVDRSDRAKDARSAARLWEVSVEPTGVDYAALAASSA